MSAARLSLLAAAALVLCVVAHMAVAQSAEPLRTCDNCANRPAHIRIGVSAQLTFNGFTEARVVPRYVSHHEGVRFATWYLNRMGGLTVEGVANDIELYTMDNGGSPFRAVDQMTQLSQNHAVDFFAGDYSGERAKVQFPQAKKLRRVIVGSSGALSVNDPLNSFAFSATIRQGEAAQRALNLYYDLIQKGELEGPLPVAIIHRDNVDGLDFAAAVREWITANTVKARSFSFKYFPYTSDLLTGIPSGTITSMAVSIRDQKLRAIIGDASTADQEAITGVLYNSNILLDLQAWAYDGAASTKFNQGLFVYSQWGTELRTSSNRNMEVLWGQYQADRHPNVRDRLPLNQYAVAGFHNVMIIAAGVRAANSLDQTKVSQAIASFKRSNPLRSGDLLLINTPDNQLYFSNGQAVYSSMLQQFSCRSVAGLSLALEPPTAAVSDAPVAFVGGECYPKRSVVIHYSAVGEFRLPQRSDETLSSSSASNVATALLLLVVAVIASVL